MCRLPPIPEEDLPLPITAIPLEYRFPLQIACTPDAPSLVLDCIRAYPRQPRMLLKKNYMYVHSMAPPKLPPQMFAGDADVDVINNRAQQTSYAELVPHYDVIVVDDFTNINPLMPAAAEYQTLIILIGISGWSPKVGWSPFGTRGVQHEFSPTCIGSRRRLLGRREVFWKDHSDNECSRYMSANEPVFYRNV